MIVYGPSANAWIYPADMVGSDALWSDDDDATYAAFGQTQSYTDAGGITTSRNSQARAWFATGLFDDVAALADTMTIFAKVSILNPGAVLGLYVADIGGNDLWGNQIITADQGFHGWVTTGPITADSPGPDYLTYGTLSDLLLGSAYAQVNNFTHPGGPNVYDFLVYEVKVLLTAAGGGRVPPIRLLQRSDGLGFSSAPRALSRSSIQGSLRNTSYL